MPSAATFAVLAFVMLPAVDPRGVYDTKRIAALQSQLTSHSGHPQLWLELGQSFAGYARADNGPVDDASLLQAVKSSVACYQAAIRLVSGDTGARPVSGVSRRPHTQHAAATRATRLRSEAYSVMGAISAEFGAVDRRPPRPYTTAALRTRRVKRAGGLRYFRLSAHALPSLRTEAVSRTLARSRPALQRWFTHVPFCRMLGCSCYKWEGSLLR